MVLNFGQDLFRGGFFKISPEDEQILEFQGGRQIPVPQTKDTATEFTFPGTVANDATVGTISWTNVNNVKTDDLNVAQATTTSGGDNSKYLKCTNFGFTLPNNAEILGIEVNVRLKGGSNDDVDDNQVRIVKSDGSFGSITKNRLNEVWWGSGGGGEFVTYGSATDIWSETWTASDINNSNFGFGISVNLQGGDSNIDGEIYFIKMKVYYRTTI